MIGVHIFTKPVEIKERNVEIRDIRKQTRQLRNVYIISAKEQNLKKTNNILNRKKSTQKDLNNKKMIRV